MLGALPLTNPDSIQLKSSSDCSAEAIGLLCWALLGEAASRVGPFRRPGTIHTDLGPRVPEPVDQ